MIWGEEWLILLYPKFYPKYRFSLTDVGGGLDVLIKATEMSLLEVIHTRLIGSCMKYSKGRSPMGFRLTTNAMIQRHAPVDFLAFIEDASIPITSNQPLTQKIAAESAAVVELPPGL